MLLGGENETRTREMMKNIIEFETEIARVTTPSEDRRDDEKLYHAMNLTSLQSTVDMVSLIELSKFSGFFHFLNWTHP